ncbi:hypothetical protein [Streptomyces sp. t39]|uniref:hypothetical protein n=1 Tax=Streptomyces sp. t39 TaxID=1828156 RepID=UPI0011CD4AD7|nr:hypothetical protein [Streptomyces sp. t39]TXS57058.1 hypothetical protein EAO77_13850 [Streptomyces sp. t39]
MPGSTTLGPGHGADAIDHPDATRLAALTGALHRLLSEDGPNRITDAQAAALCGGGAREREEFTAWMERVAARLEAAVAD